MDFIGLFGQLGGSSLIVLALVSIIAGIVRGFAGFGAGLILMPVASAVIDPKLAVVVFLITDSIASAPLLPSAMRRCNWPTVLPMAVAAVVSVPIGVFALIHSDPVVVRWGISILTMSMLVLLISGWRYRGQPRMTISFGVGAVSGFLGGIAQISGPPAVTYWMSGPFAASVIRANLITYFFFTSVGSFLAYLFTGLFTPTAIALIGMMIPTYAIAVWIGARLHGRASEATFRQVVYVLIAIAALTSLPAFDSILRP